MAVHSYLRISTSNKNQTVETQRAAIKAAGYATDYWYAEEGVSGSVEALKRPQFADMISTMKEGDILIATALDRIGRNASDIQNTTKLLESMGVKICILSFGSMDITSLYGKAFLQIIGALAELERGVIQERVQMGIDRVKGEGVKLGRHLSIPPDILAKLCDKKNQGVTLKDLKEEFGIDIMTIQRNIKKWNFKMTEYNEVYNKQQEYANAKITKEKK